ncbi:pilus assembly PilX family protein [Rhodanobacter hydrolyticus]|uniref:Type 4 fimbrial biogenesis protein PilX N-terminal domain-containing protein n=1 Tax=Rhodanobacter hydrolyticus TaxID=2250595 RepID=A0ABW8J6R7_9GAMM
MSMKSVGMGYRSGPSRQKGMISVLIAIIVLVVSLLAAMALMHSIDTSNTIAGSLSFRQGVVQEAERAYSAAKDSATLYPEPSSDSNQPTLGYYATPQAATIRPDKDIPDILVNATVASCPSAVAVCLSDLSTGNTVIYVIERLCPAVGPANPGTCIVPGASIQGGSVSNQTKDNGPPFSSGAYAAFRLSAKVIGPRGAIGYVQTVMR